MLFLILGVVGGIAALAMLGEKPGEKKATTTTSQFLTQESPKAKNPPKKGLGDTAQRPAPVVVQTPISQGLSSVTPKAENLGTPEQPGPFGELAASLKQSFGVAAPRALEIRKAPMPTAGLVSDLGKHFSSMVPLHAPSRVINEVTGKVPQ